jgi:hypothetical protein
MRSVPSTRTLWKRRFRLFGSSSSSATGTYELVASVRSAREILYEPSPAPIITIGFASCGRFCLSLYSRHAERIAIVPVTVNPVARSGTERGKSADRSMNAIVVNSAPVMSTVTARPGSGSCRKNNGGRRADEVSEEPCRDRHRGGGRHSVARPLTR